MSASIAERLRNIASYQVTNPILADNLRALAAELEEKVEQVRKVAPEEFANHRSYVLNEMLIALADSLAKPKASASPKDQ